MFELVIELNKFCQRFDGFVAKSIRSTLLEEEDDSYKNVALVTIRSINQVVALFDGWLDGCHFDEVDGWFLNKTIDMLHGYSVIVKKENFYTKYSVNYWKQMHCYILDIWRNSSFDDAEKDDLFIKIFSDILGNAIKDYPDFCNKKLGDFHNIYRAIGFEVYNAYSFIMPDPQYCKNNRWNDDGVAFLYLAYDDAGESYQNIKLGEKTCFEERRSKNGEEVAVCQFQSVNDGVRILNLAYQDIDYDALFMELNSTVIPTKNEVLSLVDEKTKVQKKLMQYTNSGREDLVKKELSKLMKQIGISEELEHKVKNMLFLTILGNICDSIFYAVDKETDPDLEAYIPFRKFSKYLMKIGFGGVAFRSTRMELCGLSGTNLVLFNPTDAKAVPGSMKVYRYHDDEPCELLKVY